MSKKVTISFVVPQTYREGDYARLCGNGGAGDIDYDVPISNQIFPLFPKGAGFYGWGHLPWGHFPWGHGTSVRTTGWGHLPWGHFPWGYGAVIISAEVVINECGDYKFAFACYDSCGNRHQGSPEELTVSVHMAPAAPGRLKKTSYNKNTGLLVLQVA